MLVLTRCTNQDIDITIPESITDEELLALRGSRIEVKLIDCRSKKARLGISAPQAIRIFRREITVNQQEFDGSVHVRQMQAVN